MILSEHYNITKYKFESSKKIFKMISEQIKLKIFLLTNIWKYDLIYCWFADYHSFLPILFAKIFRKKSFLVLGGYDVAYIPEIRYGSFSNPLRAFFTRFSIKNTYKNIAVSHYVSNEIKKKIAIPNINVVYPGVDIEKFKSLKHEKKKIILTVASVNIKKQIQLKGIDFFREVALKMPEYKFIIVGISNGMKKYLEPIPENVQVISYIKQEKLLNFYKTAKVYCQFSMVESFGLALCESMLCCCIGVVNKVGALPEVLGDTGFYLDDKNISNAVNLINLALNEDNNLGEKAKKRVIENFTCGKRKKKLYDLIENLTNE